MSIASNNKVLSLIILGITLLLYANTLSFGFVWDDHYLIEQNPKMKNISSISEFFIKDFWENSSINFKSGFYRPLTLLSFLANTHIWQGKAFGFHLFNILLHGINGVLIFTILLYLTKNQWVSFLSGLFFVIHPVQTETVAYIADVNDLLCVCFLLLSIWNYVRIRQGKNYFIVSILCLSLALLSKENAMVGFILIPLVDWFFVSKLNWNIFKEKKLIFLSYFFVVLAYIGIRMMVLGRENAIMVLQNIRYVSILPSFNVWSHILTITKILFLYIKLLFFPLALSISYIVLPSVSFFSLDVFFAAAFLFVLITLIFVCRDEKYRWISFSILWFFITVLPVSNLIPISNTIAERFLYLPMVGFSLFLGYSFDSFRNWLADTKRKELYFLGILLLSISLFSYKTVNRNLVWHSDLSLFTSALKEDPRSLIAHRNLSAYYYQQKNIVKGFAHDRAYATCLEAVQKEYTALENRVKK